MAEVLPVVVLCSTGGSSFFAASDFWTSSGRILEVHVFVESDGQAAHSARARDLRCEIVPGSAVEMEHRVIERYPSSFPVVLLLYQRILSGNFVRRFNTLNIHPSLLPRHKGLRAIEAAFESGDSTLGATLHRATTEVDAGPLLATVRSAVRPSAPLTHFRRMSFVQRSLLALYAIATAGAQQPGERQALPTTSHLCVNFDTESAVHLEGGEVPGVPTPELNAFLTWCWRDLSVERQ